MARSIFRRRWFPGPKKRFAPASISASFNLTGVSSTASVGTLSIALSKNVNLTGLAATSSVGTITETASGNVSLTGVAATTSVGVFSDTISENFNLTGVVASSNVGVFSEELDKDFDLTGVAATAQLSVPTIGFTLIGVSSTTSVGTFTETADEDFNLTGVVASSSVGTFVEIADGDFVLTGASAASNVGTFSEELDKDFDLTGVETMSDIGTIVPGFELFGVEATTEFAIPSILLSSNVPLTGVAATSSSGVVVGNAPTFHLTGVSATSQLGISLKSADHHLFGVQAFSEVNTDSFVAFRDVLLTGVSAAAAGFFISGAAAGGGGGGCAGVSGRGFRGFDGSGDGIGGAGGDGDFGVVPGQTTPSGTGLSGTEFDISHGIGSGGAGASFGNNPGGDGGTYGGGGGGGTGGGGGIGGAGVVFLKYLGDGAVWKTIVLNVADNINSPLVMPDDWSNTNYVYIVSSGGCGSSGSLLAGGNGGSGGSILWGQDIGVWSPGQIIAYHIPAGCATGGITFGAYGIDNGGNATDTAAGLPGTHYTSFPGGTHAFSEGGATGYIGAGLGGGGGSLFEFSFTGSEEDPFSNAATAEVGSFNLGGVPGDRTFIIGAIEQEPIAPGIVLLPTSEDITFSGADPYVFGSSQYYTIGEVHWDSALKLQGVDWEFVDPFKHIIHLLTPPAPSTVVTLIYYRWNIGVRSGFKVNSYPVPFAFTGTTIVAERVPLENKFFTVEYTSIRPGDNPRTMFAIFPNMVDDLLVQHDLYDGANGFQTYRPAGYTVYDTTANDVWEWDGSVWFSLGPFVPGSLFYVKRLKQVYEYNGVAVVTYTAGDGSSFIPQVLTYPPFGESIGKNFLVDAFSANAAVDYPSAYEVAQSPGDYDPWLPGL